MQAHVEEEMIHDCSLDIAAIGSLNCNIKEHKAVDRLKIAEIPKTTRCAMSEN